MTGYCYMCHKYTDLERHHIFGGAYRDKSEKYGLTVDLCHACHNEPPDGVHHNAKNNEVIKRLGQIRAMGDNNWTVEDFIREFGKNYYGGQND